MEAIAQCTMDGGNIVGCTYDSYGGGVCVSDKAVFTMNGGSIRGCTVTDTQHGFGGGVYVVAGTFIMSGGSMLHGRVTGKVICTGNIISGVFNDEVVNNGRITGGIFYGTVSGTGIIEDSARAVVSFDSWADSGAAFDFTALIIRDMTLTAAWTL